MFGCEVPHTLLAPSDLAIMEPFLCHVSVSQASITTFVPSTRPVANTFPLPEKSESNTLVSVIDLVLSKPLLKSHTSRWPSASRCTIWVASGERRKPLSIVEPFQECRVSLRVIESHKATPLPDG